MLALATRMSSNLTPTDFPCSSKLRTANSNHHQNNQLEPLYSDPAVEQQQRRRKQVNRKPRQQPSEWKPEQFPHKMYDLLEEVEERGLDHIVSWCDDGKSFRIYSHMAFENSIMPSYFSGMSSYKSFRRQLNLYGIYQHRHRPTQDVNAYSHEYFVRGRRHLCDLMGRKKSNSGTKSKASKTGQKKLSNNSVVAKDKISKSNSNESNVNQKKRGTTSLAREMIDATVALHNSTATNATTISTTDDIIRQNILMKSIYDDETLTRPKPIDYSSIRLSTNENNDGKGSNSSNSFNNNTFQSFMGQYWEDLPNGLSSTQVVDEIIATFQQQHRQQHR